MIKGFTRFTAVILLCVLLSACGSALFPTPSPQTIPDRPPTAVPQPTPEATPEGSEDTRLYPDALLPYCYSYADKFGIVDTSGNVLFEPCFDIYYVDCTDDALERWGEKAVALHQTLPTAERGKWAELFEGEYWVDKYAQEALSGESYILFPLSGKLFGPFPGRVNSVSAGRVYLDFFYYYNEGRQHKALCFSLEDGKLEFEVNGQQMFFYEKDYLIVQHEDKSWFSVDRDGNMRAIEAETVSLAGNMAVVSWGGDLSRVLSLDTGEYIAGFQEVQQFYSVGGSYYVFSRRGLWGLCDSAGKEIVPAKYDNYDYRNEPFFVGLLGERFLLFDISGAEPRLCFDSKDYPDAEAFQYYGSGLLTFTMGSCCHMFDAVSGNVTVLDEGISFWGEMNSALYINKDLGNTSATAMVNRKGELLTPWHEYPSYSYATGNAFIMVDIYDRKEALYSVYDTDGKLLFQTEGFIFPINDYFFAVRRGSAYGVVDRDGDWVFRRVGYGLLRD